MNDAGGTQGMKGKGVSYVGVVLALVGFGAIVVSLAQGVWVRVCAGVAGSGLGLVGLRMMWFKWRGEPSMGGGRGETHRRFEAVLAAMHDAIIETSWQGIREVNDSFCRMTGFSREELIGAKAPFPFWPAEEYARIAAALETLMRGQARDFELVLNRKNGERFAVLLSVSRMLEGKGRGKAGEGANRVLYSFRDISELKAAEAAQRRQAAALLAAKEQAEAAHREKDELLQLLKLELRTPMTPILALASSLKKDARLPADMREEMAIIQRNAEEAKAMIDDVLKKAKRERAATPVAGGGAEARRGLRILLVEDHADSARVVTRILEGCGHVVSGARTVKQARQTLEEKPAERLDLVISDLMLPDGTGYEVMAALRDADGGACTVPAIAFSGHGSEGDIEKSRQAGFAEHLTKPVNVEELLAMVERLGGRRNAAARPADAALL